ncbi:hypothetical protein GRQ65_20620 [Nocardioides sp. YIM 123512]|uniref:Outer membrane channel protein CpnT-like N-terminal domain-containing protein n=2 Tax=Nocardioides flavescens TaxID=2691959 RepID=A0A6L7F3Z6_9ACTN|nr:hypothetical protein [Nocardioides flavescens]
MVTVDPAAFDRAAESFALANKVAAQLCTGMEGALAGYGQMAGDDKTSDDFAAGYDGAAADTMAAAADLVGALAALALITSASGANHRGANNASRYSKTPPEYTGGQFDPLPDTTVTVGAFTPPSAVGGDDPGTPKFWDMLTDYLEGWTWPGADVARLRRAGETWRHFGRMLQTSVSPYLDVAVSELEGQESPEVGTATSVTRGLLLEIEQFKVHCEDLGNACDDYATQVEAVRETVRGILEDLAVEIGITAVIAGVGSLFTAGGAGAAGGVVAGWRLAAAARKVIGAFTAMKAVVRAAAVVRLTRVAGKVPILARRFRRISDAANRAKHEKFLVELRREMGRPSTKDPDLTKLMRENYRDNAQVGSGSTAAAVRHELATGQPVGGAFHSQKAQEMIGRLEKWLRNHPDASPGDRAAAENVIKDLQDALSGK